MRVAAHLAVLLLVLPAVAGVASAQGDGETSFITFYGHVFGTGRAAPMPMNTETPDGEPDYSRAASDGCGIDPTGLAGGDPSCENDDDDEMWWYSTAGFVDVTETDEFDYANVHNERGLTKDFLLDTTKDVHATFYMSADMHGWFLLISDPNRFAPAPTDPEDVPWPGPTWNWDPGALPQWQVKATLLAGTLGEYGGMANTPPDVGAALNDTGDFEVIAEGVSAPIDVVSLEAAGQPTVWRFDVPMGAPKASVIPKEKSLLVRYQWWSTALGGRHIVPEVMSWNVNSGEFYPPNIVIPVKNAFEVELVVPQFLHDKLVLLALVNTPWGSYDVDPDSVALTVTNANGAEVTPVRISRLSDFSVAHGGHYKPVNVTWVWDYQRDRLAPGTYTATVSAANHQHSASAECSATFTVLAGGEPGTFTIGECGVRTGDDAQVEAAQEAATSTTGRDPSGLPPLPLAPLAGLGVVLLRRRWP